MQWDMPKCSLSVRTGQTDLPLIPVQFEFRYHYDDRDQRYPRLSDLMRRLGALGFTCRGVPVSGVCSFQLARAVVPSLNNVMIEFSGGGADWLEHLVATLESLRAVNAEHPAHDQFYDPCSL
jgi:hypothetical protein